MGQSQTSNEIYPFHGDLPADSLPIAASQTLLPGEPVYWNGTGLARWIATSAQGTTSQQFCGWINEPTSRTVNGSVVSLAAGTLVAFIPCARNVMWTLPSYGTTPLISMLMSGANTAGFTVYNDAGVYKIDLSVTTNAVVRPWNFDLEDARMPGLGAIQWKTPFVVGDRMKCSILPAAKQVDW